MGPTILVVPTEYHTTNTSCNGTWWLAWSFLQTIPVILRIRIYTEVKPSSITKQKKCWVYVSSVHPTRVHIQRLHFSRNCIHHIYHAETLNLPLGYLLQLIMHRPHNISCTLQVGMPVAALSYIVSKQEVTNDMSHTKSKCCTNTDVKKCTQPIQRYCLMFFYKN